MTDAEKHKLEQRILKRFHKALSAYSLIEDNDKVLVALSGGKDSLCLLELLARRMRIQRPLFKVEAIHIRMENIHYETDTAYLQNFAAASACRSISSQHGLTPMPEQKAAAASCVRGTGGKRYSTRRKSLGATRLHWATISTTLCRQH